jgi:hypothetical protein
MKRISAALFVLLLPVVAAAHGGMREIKGTLVKINRDSVVVKRVDGKNESVPLSASTIYRVGDAKGNRRDMRAGSRVIVHFGRDGKALEIHLPSR